MRRSLLWLCLLLSAALPGGAATSTVRHYEVSIHRSKHAKCSGADLRIDRSGVKATRCRDIDFSLTTPAEAKGIVETIRDVKPSLSRVEGCREK
jgi:hypothetical protein